MKRNLIQLVLVALVLTGCTTSSVPKTTSSSQEKTEQVNLSTLYTDLPQENQFIQMKKEDVKDFLKNGTGILTLGFPECKWCQAYYPQFNEVLKNSSVQTRYFNIYEQKKANRPFYDEIAMLLESQNTTGTTIVQHDNDGKQVIYVPLVLFVEKGKIVAFDNETSDVHGMETKDYWTTEKKATLKERLSNYVNQNKKAQANNQAGGCNTEEKTACKAS